MRALDIVSRNGRDMGSHLDYLTDIAKAVVSMSQELAARFRDDTELEPRASGLHAVAEHLQEGLEESQELLGALLKASAAEATGERA